MFRSALLIALIYLHSIEGGEATHMGRFGSRAEVDAPPREQERKSMTAEEHNAEQESPFCASGQSIGKRKCRVSRSDMEKKKRRATLATTSAARECVHSPMLLM